MDDLKKLLDKTETEEETTTMTTTTITLHEDDARRIIVDHMGWEEIDADSFIRLAKKQTADKGWLVRNSSESLRKPMLGLSPKLPPTARRGAESDSSDSISLYPRYARTRVRA